MGSLGWQDGKVARCPITHPTIQVLPLPMPEVRPHRDKRIPTKDEREIRELRQAAKEKARQQDIENSRLVK